MATWDPPSDAELAPDKPGKASIARRLRDLFLALAQRASGSSWICGIGAIEFIRGFSG